MNRSLPTKCRAIVALLAVALLPQAEVNAQSQRYQAPSFAGMAAQTNGTAPQIPGFPASPLAGGPAAAQGGEYMDVYGQPIAMQSGVMQAGFSQSCPGGCYGDPGGYCQSCPPGGYGGGDPMAVDFGGYGQDQCGPHYFDVSADVVFLQATELFTNVGPLSAAGVDGTRLLDPENSSDDYEPGWQISARYDIGALAVLEATYMGLYDIGFNDSVQSIDAFGANFSLFSTFSDFGNNPPFLGGFDLADLHSIDYQSDLQSTEFSYRRYWLGNNTRVSGTWLAGFRYLRMTEDFLFSSVGAVTPSPANPTGIANASRLWSSENDLLGFQLGGDGWLCLRQGLRIGGEAKSGIYNNRFKFRHAASLPLDPDFDVEAEGNQIAFAAEGGVTVVADILPSWSLRGGYRVLYLNSLATVGNNITGNVNSVAVATQAHALYHGFHGGFEYIW